MANRDELLRLQAQLAVQQAELTRLLATSQQSGPGNTGGFQIEQIKQGMTTEDRKAACDAILTALRGN